MYFYSIQEPTEHIIQELAVISANQPAIGAENLQFRAYLEGFESAELDQLVYDLEKSISPKVDCTQCGNCCKSLMINVTDAEANHLAGKLSLKRAQFDEQYLEKGMHGQMLINAIPCHFLSDNKCKVYEHRFEGCREFPALHLPHFQKRLFSHFMHYHRCPIIYNVIEQLKTKLSFQKQTHD